MKLATYRSSRAALVALALGILVTAAHPDDRSAWKEAFEQLKSGNYAEAAAEFQVLVDQAPDYDYGYYAIGISFLSLHKFEDAERNFRKALELDGDKFQYHHGLAHSLMRLHRYDDVVRALGRAEGLATDDQRKQLLYSMRGFAYAAQRKWSEAIEDLERARGTESDRLVVGQLAKAYYALGHHDKALPLFRDVLRADPEDAETLELVARACIQRGREARDEQEKLKQYRNALDAAEQCAALRSGSHETTNLVGKAALGAGEFSKAEQAFRQVLSIRSDSCFAMINLGKTYIAMERYEAAEQPLKDAAACAPRESTIHENLGLVYQKYGKRAQQSEEWEKAFAYYDQAVKYYDQAAGLKNSPFIDKAVETIEGNIEVIRHNVDAEKLEIEQRKLQDQIQKDEEELRRKIEQWDKKRRRGD